MAGSTLTAPDGASGWVSLADTMHSVVRQVAAVSSSVEHGLALGATGSDAGTAAPSPLAGEASSPRSLMATFDPEDENYQRELVTTIAPLYICAVVTLVMCVIFLLIRLLCCCCGRGCCAKASEDQPKSSCSVISSRVIAGMFALLAFSGGCTMLSSAGPFRTDLEQLSKTLVAQVDEVAASVTGVIDDLSDNMPASVGMDLEDLRQAKADIADIQEDVYDYQELFDDGVSKLELAILVLGVFVLVVTVIGAASIVFRRYKVMLVFLTWSWILAVLLWLVGGTSYTAHHVTSELCEMMTSHLRVEPNAWISDMCPDSSDARALLQDAMDSAVVLVGNANEQFTDLNSAILDTWTRRNAVCGTAPARDSTACQEHTDEAPQLDMLCSPFVKQDGTYIPTAVCPTGTVALTKDAVAESYFTQRCSKDVSQENPETDPNMQICMNEGTPLPKNYYADIYEYAASAQVMTATIPVIMDIFDCKFIDNMFEAVTRDVCPGLLDSSETLTGGAVTAAVGLTLVALFISIFFSWVRKQHAANVHQYHGHAPTAPPAQALAAKVASKTNEAQSSQMDASGRINTQIYV